MPEAWEVPRTQDVDTHFVRGFILWVRAGGEDTFPNVCELCGQLSVLKEDIGCCEKKIGSPFGLPIRLRI